MEIGNPQNSRPVIVAQNLSKKYGDLTAVNGIDFSVQPGEFFGFVGPNGAGKTTTISMLSTLLRPSSGHALVNGYDVVANKNEVRQSIGIIFQEPALDLELSAWENLWFHARLYKVPRDEFNNRAADLLTVVGLADRRNATVKTFSGGMKRRLEIARGLLHYPAVLFLDEPTIGLDPQTRALIWRYLNDIRAHWKITVFLTTHYLPETDNCDHVAIIDKGTIIAYGTPAELKAHFRQDSMDGVFLEATGHGIRDEEISLEDQARVAFKQRGGSWR